ncbi:GM18110 [Drosophila sechellia]|uniref:GM18110 n=1 Tax=Drosophila sechellia TaxID=7238 RepID=B4I357_DROSE|nr:GM18110 [Drosophila sechellia]
MPKQLGKLKANEMEMEAGERDVQMWKMEMRKMPCTVDGGDDEEWTVPGDSPGLSNMSCDPRTLIICLNPLPPLCLNP